MSKGMYRGKPLETFSKEELIDLVVMLVTQHQQGLREAIDLEQGPDGVWAVNEKD
jgi:hypothetical protein